MTLIDKLLHRGDDIWPDPDTDTVGQLTDTDEPWEPGEYMREPEPLPALPQVHIDPDAPCAVCGATGTLKLRAELTGRWFAYPLCADLEGCGLRCIQAAREKAIGVPVEQLPTELPDVAGARATTASETSGAVTPTAGADEHPYPLEMARAAVDHVGELSVPAAASEEPVPAEVPGGGGDQQDGEVES